MGLHEVLGRDYGIEEPYGGPCKNDSLLSPSLHYKSPVVSQIKNTEVVHAVVIQLDFSLFTVVY